jgi:hypothetical protein
MLPAIAQRTHCQNGCLIADKWNCSSPPLRRMIRGDGRTIIGKVDNLREGGHPARARKGEDFGTSFHIELI